MARSYLDTTAIKPRHLCRCRLCLDHQMSCAHRFRGRLLIDHHVDSNRFYSVISFSS